MSSNPNVDAKKPSFTGLWLKVMRVPFLQATFVPIILGGVIAWETLRAFNWGTLLFTLLGASLIQIASNMFNDYFDFKSGNDLQVRHQNPFAGGGRILTAGLIKPSTHLLLFSHLLPYDYSVLQYCGSTSFLVWTRTRRLERRPWS